MRVALITTGAMEFAGLASALHRLFPDHDFEALRRGPDSGNFDGFTSNRLPVDGASDGVRSSLGQMIRRAAGALSPGDGSLRADVVVILDDLELANADQPDVVVRVVRDEVERFLASLSPNNQSRTRRAFRARLSFHLAVPMTESWLFADPGGLQRAGVPNAQNSPRIACGSRFEGFVTDDSDYLGDTCARCELWQAVVNSPRRVTKSKRKANQPEWCKGDAPQNAHHPKRYLAWLCRDYGLKRCSSYRETSTRQGTATGASALASLDWTPIFEGDVDMPFLNALIDDLADALREPCPLAPSSKLASETQRDASTTPPRLLRNL